MTKSGITQEELAKTVGIGQPAISNMLKRQCRPQKRTVERLAEALKLSPQDLWPNYVKTE
jgi:transcriptional regulator with XRE-family HTH domain